MAEAVVQVWCQRGGGIAAGVVMGCADNNFCNYYLKENCMFFNNDTHEI